MDDSKRKKRSHGQWGDKGEEDSQRHALLVGAGVGDERCEPKVCQAGLQPATLHLCTQAYGNFHLVCSSQLQAALVQGMRCGSRGTHIATI